MELQVEELQQAGVPLELSRFNKNVEIFLYALHGFYVELYVQVNSNELLLIKSFTSEKKLEPYLHQVNISEIRHLLSSNA